MKIYVTDMDGVEHALCPNEGERITEIVVGAGLPLEAICGGSCACATCHVYMHADWLERLKPRAEEEEEEDMLDMAFSVRSNSRSSCRIETTPELDGPAMTIAES